ncbi:hypothetical protein [Paracoccus shandongensis]|uniref:hypothetical protein n=1 Tax=Paracoccus shandongensis TaxID=2816048 RepID=UPI001A8FE642
MRDDPDGIRVTDAQVACILAEATHLLPHLNLTRADVVHCWCGVRPTPTLDGQDTVLPVRVAEQPGRRGAAAKGAILRTEHVTHLDDLIRRRLPDGLDPDPCRARPKTCPASPQPPSAGPRGAASRNCAASTREPTASIPP